MWILCLFTVALFVYVVVLLYCYLCVVLCDVFSYVTCLCWLFMFGFGLVVWYIFVEYLRCFCLILLILGVCCLFGAFSVGVSCLSSFIAAVLFCCYDCWLIVCLIVLLYMVLYCMLLLLF